MILNTAKLYQHLRSLIPTSAINKYGEPIFLYSKTSSYALDNLRAWHQIMYPPLTKAFHPNDT